MNKDKLGEMFKVDKVKSVTIIGCGSIGSTITELLARYGIQKFVLYDDDYIVEHNVVNQLFTQEDVHKQKVDALEEILKRINPSVVVEKHNERYENQPISGYVFMCLDNMTIRKRILENFEGNFSIKSVSDCRTSYLSSESFFADWSDSEQVEKILKSVNLYTQEEAEAELENSGVRNACGLEYCVAPTVRLVCNYAVLNFINFVSGYKIWNVAFIQNDPNNTDISMF